MYILHSTAAKSHFTMLTTSAAVAGKLKQSSRKVLGSYLIYVVMEQPANSDTVTNESLRNLRDRQAEGGLYSTHRSVTPTNRRP